MKRRLSVTLLFILALTLLPTRRSYSHPHVFLETALTIVFDHEGLAGVRVKWLFDEMFSSMILLDFDLNKDQKLEKKEIGLIRQNAFANLKNFGYFTSIKINGKPFKVKLVSDFTAALKENQLVYEFMIPCHVRATKRYKEFRVSQYDREYYSAVFYAREKPFTYEGTSSFDIEHWAEKNPDDSYYFGQIVPIELITKFKLKSG